MSEQIKSLYYNIIRRPIVSEKSTMLSDQFGQFVFEIAKNATKPQVKSAIEKLFKVNVVSVRVLNTKPKRKSFKQTMGQRRHWKKAVVTLQKGQDIDFTAI